MRTRLLLFLGLAFFTFGFTPEMSTETEPAKTVYVCGQSKIYHPTDTHGALKRCKSGITSMSEADAKDMGKRICKCKG